MMAVRGCDDSLGTTGCNKARAIANELDIGVLYRVASPRTTITTPQFSRVMASQPHDS